MPTEAEWEYAARGGKYSQHTQYYFGNDAKALSRHAWFEESTRPYAHAVDEVNPATGTENLTQLGLANMLGNIWEWCNDWYSIYSVPQEGDEVIRNPVGPQTGRNKVRRGAVSTIRTIDCDVRIVTSIDPTGQVATAFVWWHASHKFLIKP